VYESPKNGMLTYLMNNTLTQLSFLFSSLTSFFNPWMHADIRGALRFLELVKIESAGGLTHVTFIVIHNRYEFEFLLHSGGSALSLATKKHQGRYKEIADADPEILGDCLGS